MHRDLRVAGPVRGRAATVAVAGFYVLLLSWILVIPPFGGTDEFDHAFRAAGTARGEWFVTPTDATQGTGAWMDVSPDLVRAAQPECNARIYTTPARCAGTVVGGQVRIASTAGRYHPLFYAVVGTVALPFSGDQALYAMRLATAALAALFVALALVAVRAWGRTTSAPVAVVVACSPMVAYSCAIVAPNGVEMTAALAFWCALVGLAVADERFLRRLIVVALVSGVALCTLRSLGPLWCAGIAAAVLVGVRRPDGRLKELARRRDARIGVTAVTLSALQGGIWTMTMGALQLAQGSHGHTSLDSRVLKVAVLAPVWLFQCIAAFPQREDPTHPSVYVCYLVVFGVLAVTGLRAADTRLRAAFAGIAGFCLVFPFVTTVSSYDAFGTAWQGRYGLPLSLGTVILCGFALDRAGRGLPTRWATLVPVLFVVAQVVSVGWTLHVELGRSPLADSSAWLRAPVWLACSLALVGSAAMVYGARSGASDPSSDAPARSEVGKGRDRRVPTT